MKAKPLTLKFPIMDIDKLQLRVYTDAAFGNLHDAGSQGAYVILASDGERTAPLDWSSHRLKRVSRSTLTAETQALLDGIDAAVFSPTARAYMRVLRPQT